MAQVDIYLAEDFKLPSGRFLGFYGEGGFGDPLSLGEFNGRTYVTNSAGNNQIFEADNNKLITTGGFSGVGGVSGVIIGQTGSGILLRQLPNYLATFNVRFTHNVDVRTQSANLIVFDGTNQNNPPSGVSVYGAEIIHTDQNQNNTGTGDSTWNKIGGSGSELGLIDSPGTSGFRPAGPATLDTRHDWYVAMSITPTTPGDKTFAFAVELEFI